MDSRSHVKPWPRPWGFENLRAAGAFLVSTAWDGRAISSPVVVVSEKGATARIKKPWDKLRVVRTRDSRTIDGRSEGEVLEFPTDTGERYLLERL
jgi:hypothetical protein